MSLSYEALLMLLALALYVHDALLLLAPNELVLVQRRKGRWQAAFGVHGWKLRHREPWLPNLLAPWQGIVRLHWRFEDGLDGEPTPGGPQLPAVGLGPRAGVTVLGALIFVALPLCLFVWSFLVWTLAVVAGIYLSCVVVLFTLRRDARAQGLDRKAFGKLCVECITCPPFCINAVRKLTLQARSQVQLRDVVEMAASAGATNALKEQLRLRLQEQIDMEPEGSARMARLRDVTQSLDLSEERA